MQFISLLWKLFYKINCFVTYTKNVIVPVCFGFLISFRSRFLKEMWKLVNLNKQYQWIDNSNIPVTNNRLRVLNTIDLLITKTVARLFILRSFLPAIDISVQIFRSTRDRKLWPFKIIERLSSSHRLNTTPLHLLLLGSAPPFTLEDRKNEP